MDDFSSRRCVRVNNGPIILSDGPTGLAVGSCLKEKGVPCVILERPDCVITSLWQKRVYDRLKLHLPKQFCCHLPNMPFPAHYPEYYPTLIGDFCGPVLTHVSECKLSGETTYRGTKVPQCLQEETDNFFKKDEFPKGPKGNWFHKERSSCRRRPPLRLIKQPCKMVVTQNKKGDKKAK